MASSQGNSGLTSGTRLRPSITLLEANLPTFQLWGHTGFELGLLQSMLLVRYFGPSPWTQLGITGSSSSPLP